jgi:hypothetical protein
MVIIMIHFINTENTVKLFILLIFYVTKTKQKKTHTQRKRIGI